MDSWKLCQRFRRPEPRGAQDIGTWETIFDIIGNVSVVTNGALIFFTGKRFMHESVATRLTYFLLFEHGIILLKYVLAIAVPDVTEQTEIQVGSLVR